jgi:putative multiple sugar transport system ATP-binding protein
MVSHKLKEVIKVADTVTVLRDGKTICSLDAHKDEVSEPVLIKHMVGREITDVFPKRKVKNIGDVIFEVKNLNAYDPTTSKQILKDVNIKARSGEVVGIAGLMGAGRTELAYSIFGNPKGYRVNGEIYVEGKLMNFKNPSDAIGAGVAYVTEDRKGEGLILIQDVKSNITLSNLREIANNWIIDDNKEITVADEYKKSLNIKTPSIEQKVQNLSGGNQQKVSLAKWLFTKPKILILDEPTRGIDVGAKFEIYNIINDLVSQGMCILMISSELPEILGMSDRVYIMSQGIITGELPIEEASQDKIMEFATV